MTCIDYRILAVTVKSAAILATFAFSMNLSAHRTSLAAGRELDGRSLLENEWGGVVPSGRNVIGCSRTDVRCDPLCTVTRWVAAFHLVLFPGLLNASQGDGALSFRFAGQYQCFHGHFSETGYRDTQSVVLIQLGYLVAAVVARSDHDLGPGATDLIGLGLSSLETRFSPFRDGHQAPSTSAAQTLCSIWYHFPEVLSDGANNAARLLDQSPLASEVAGIMIGCRLGVNRRIE